MIFKSKKKKVKYLKLPELNLGLFKILYENNQVEFLKYDPCIVDEHSRVTIYDESVIFDYTGDGHVLYCKPVFLHGFEFIVTNIVHTDHYHYEGVILLSGIWFRFRETLNYPILDKNYDFIHSKVNNELTTKIDTSTFNDKTRQIYDIITSSSPKIIVAPYSQESLRCGDVIKHTFPVYIWGDVENSILDFMDIVSVEGQMDEIKIGGFTVKVYHVLTNEQNHILNYLKKLSEKYCYDYISCMNDVEGQDKFMIFMNIIDILRAI